MFINFTLVSTCTGYYLYHCIMKCWRQCHWCGLQLFYPVDRTTFNSIITILCRCPYSIRWHPAPTGASCPSRMWTWRVWDSQLVVETFIPFSKYVIHNRLTLIKLWLAEYSDKWWKYISTREKESKTPSCCIFLFNTFILYIVLFVLMIFYISIWQHFIHYSCTYFHAFLLISIASDANLSCTIACRWEQSLGVF